MIHVVIGQSGAGKTTFVKSRWLPGADEIRSDWGVPYTICGPTAAIGRYYIGERCEGTDTVSYNAGAAILRTVDKIVCRHTIVVLEGDRITNRRTLEYLLHRGYDCQLWLLRCSVNESLSRLRAAGSSISATFVRGTRTKAMRLFLDYGGAMRGQVVSTGGRPE